jgi:hypothetical protein
MRVLQSVCEMTFGLCNCCAPVAVAVWTSTVLEGKPCEHRADAETSRSTLFGSATGVDDALQALRGFMSSDDPCKDEPVEVLQQARSALLQLIR